MYAIVVLKVHKKLLWYMIRIFSSSYESAGWASCLWASYSVSLIKLVFIILSIMNYKFIYFYNLNKRSLIIDYRVYNYTESPAINFHQRNNQILLLILIIEKVAMQFSRFWRLFILVSLIMWLLKNLCIKTFVLQF